MKTLSEQKERLVWLRHVLSDPDAPRFYSASQLDEMEEEKIRLEKELEK